MDELHIEERCEVVLTYRQPEPEEEIQPVVLRYERPLPASMVRPPEPEEEEENMWEWPEPPAGAPEPPPMTLPDRPLWQSAIAPPERARGKDRWGVRLFVGLSLLVILVCLGVGLWYVQEHGWTLTGGGSSQGNGPHGGSQDDGPMPPQGDDYYYHWEEDDRGDRETTVPRYPTGGNARLSLTTAQDRTPLTIQEVYAVVSPSTVTVLGDAGDLYSVGTGVIFTADGYILTNHHVIEGCSECTVWVDGEYGVVQDYTAKLVASDEEIDLAVLKVEAEDLPAAEFGVSDDLIVGDPAYAIGNPLGTELRNTLTPGVVSYINREVNVDGVTMTLIQTSAALNSGNSGGPLINQYGQVIGINTIKMMSETNTIEGLGFAIPSSLFVRWVNELIEFGVVEPQPMLGLTILRTPTRLPDGTTGLEVDAVTAGGSGDQAGVRVGDFITHFGGERVYSVDQILAIRRQLHVGDQVDIRVCRDGQYLELTMVLQAA